ncbi:hypothetical protein OHA72_04655 [Dactylosporangium sp. NBC_01737]|uniref:hypothetical protein n=1 Tax=Dactylosporangium sp. NBC_01737 TaxID=2975959 RepID=UPI002E13B213|nr:hypothetical protein OHA72_04655 [Dactylosporangium sp. NBC_01737]
MELSPQQRDRLARLLQAELGTLRDAAATSGTDADAVTETVDARRRALESDTPDGAAPGDERS